MEAKIMPSSSVLSRGTSFKKNISISKHHIPWAKISHNCSVIEKLCAENLLPLPGRAWANQSQRTEQRWKSNRNNQHIQRALPTSRCFKILEAGCKLAFEEQKVPFIGDYWQQSDLIGNFPENLVHWLELLALDTSCRSLFTEILKIFLWICLLPASPVKVKMITRCTND